MTAGRPTRSSAASASSKDFTIRAFGLGMPIFSMAARKRSRSSALSITSALAPIISTPRRSSTPLFASSMPQFSAVCPPMVGSRASGRSFSRMRVTTSRVIGST